MCVCVCVCVCVRVCVCVCVYGKKQGGRRVRTSQTSPPRLLLPYEYYHILMTALLMALPINSLLYIKNSVCSPGLIKIGLCV